MSDLDSRLTSVTAKAVAVPGDDIDTDRIMPARYLRCVTFESIGQYTFQDERYDAQGNAKPHPFNERRGREAGILVVNRNFGCGSSREHAPQGILRWGIRAIVGESFAEIFAGNCAAIGLPAVTAGGAEIRRLMDWIAANPSGEVTVDLAKKELRAGDVRFPVEMKEAARTGFLEGTWDTTATLASAMDQVRRTASGLPYLKWTATTR
jgi:3-isopropylmalate/(R)-2-methylmalate dehydratase small subunit